MVVNLKENVSKAWPYTLLLKFTQYVESISKPRLMSFTYDPWKITTAKISRPTPDQTPDQKTFNIIYVRSFRHTMIGLNTKHLSPHTSITKIEFLSSFLLKFTLFKSSKSTLGPADHYSTAGTDWGLSFVCCPGSLRLVAPAQCLPSRGSGKTMCDLVHPKG